MLLGSEIQEKINPKSTCEKVSFWALIFVDFGVIGARKPLGNHCFYNGFLMLRVFEHDASKVDFPARKVLENGAK